jgi:hypothetical protein
MRRPLDPTQHRRLASAISSRGGRASNSRRSIMSRKVRTIRLVMIPSQVRSPHHRAFRSSRDFRVSQTTHVARTKLVLLFHRPIFVLPSARPGSFQSSPLRSF